MTGYSKALHVRLAAEVPVATTVPERGPGGLADRHLGRDPDSDLAVGPGRRSSRVGGGTYDEVVLMAGSWSRWASPSEAF